MRTASSSSIAFCRGVAPRRAAVDAQRLRDLIADREDRVERGHRLLEDEADLGAAHAAHLALGERQQVASLEDGPGRRAIRPGGCTSRMIDSAVTDLPLPDSPTRPSVSPGATLEADVDRPPARTVRPIEAGGEVRRPRAGIEVRGRGIDAASIHPDAIRSISDITPCARRRPRAWRRRSRRRSRALRRRAMIGGTRLSPSARRRDDRVERRRHAPASRDARTARTRSTWRRSISGSMLQDLDAGARSSVAKRLTPTTTVLAGVDRAAARDRRTPGSRAG